MTAPHPVASRSPDRTGVCGADQGAPSAREMTIGQGFPSPNQPDKGRRTRIPALNSLLCKKLHTTITYILSDVI